MWLMIWADAVDIEKSLDTVRGSGGQLQEWESYARSSSHKIINRDSTNKLH